MTWEEWAEACGGPLLHPKQRTTNNEHWRGPSEECLSLIGSDTINVEGSRERERERERAAKTAGRVPLEKKDKAVARRRGQQPTQENLRGRDRTSFPQTQREEVAVASWGRNWEPRGT